MSTQTSSLYGEPAAHEAGLHRSLPLEGGISLVQSETSRGHRQEFTSKTHSEATNRGKGCRGVMYICRATQRSVPGAGCRRKLAESERIGRDVEQEVLLWGQLSPEPMT